MITARTITKDLAGQSFSVKNAVDGTEVKFEFPSSFDGWPRRGGEAIVAPVVCKHPRQGDIPSIMKFFTHVVPQRAKRQKYLVNHHLAGRFDWLYEAVPYLWVDKTVAGHRLYGHVAKHVCYNRPGDDFERVREHDTDNMDTFSEDNRREMAAQLCNAIVGLERLNIVHSDLSPKNIIICKYSDNEMRCVLIDYDGFQSSRAPKLPRQHNGNQVRMLGTPGYQHPDLMRRIEQDNGTDDALFVENDRFALGVLCFELLTWTTATAGSRAAGQTGLINEAELKRGRLDLPAAARSVWPEGFKLLEEAVKEPDINSLPGPEDWLQALQPELRLRNRKNWTTTVFLKIYRQCGNQTPVKKQLLHFEGQSGRGALEKVDPRLSDIAYSYKNENGRCISFKLHITSAAPVILRQDGKTKNLGVRPDEVEVGPDDQILTDGWLLKFQDASRGMDW